MLSVEGPLRASYTQHSTLNIQHFSEPTRYEGESLRELDRRLLVASPVKNRDLSDATGNLGIGRRGKLLRERAAKRRIIGVEPHLDQFVRVERFLRLDDNRIAHAGFADADDRRERMREAFEELPLLRRECHRRRLCQFRCTAVK